MMNKQCPQLTSAREVLAKLISAPGVLAGRDFITGERYPRLFMQDIDDFVDAHLLGPGRRDRPPRITVDDDAGERSIESFVRSELLPVSNEGTCTHLVVGVQTSNAEQPDDGLLATAISMRDHPAYQYMERSVMTGLWNLWFVFESPISRKEALAFAEEVRRTLQVFATPSHHYAIPLLDRDGSTGSLLPSPFYSGGFLGVLFGISHDAYLTALPIEPPPKCDRSSRSEVAGGREGSDVETLEGMLSSWCAILPGRYARAGEILSALSERAMLKGALALLAPNSAAILLGRQLLAYARRNDGKFVVMATKSGHSRRFFIRLREWSPAWEA